MRIDFQVNSESCKIPAIICKIPDWLVQSVNVEPLQNVYLKLSILYETTTFFVNCFFDAD